MPQAHLCKLAFVTLCLCLAGGLTPANAQETASPAKQAEKKPNAGKFILSIRGKDAGTSRYSFDSDGGSEATDSVTVDGQKLEFKVSVKMKAGKLAAFGADAGTVNHYTATVDGDKARIAINDGAPAAQAIPAGAAPFGNFSPHLMHYVLAKYDAKKGGAQPVTMMLIEGLPAGQIVTLQGKLTASMNEMLKVDGKVISATVWKLAIDAGGMEIAITLHADADRHILLWEVPSQQYTAVKEGYEDLLKASSSGK